MFFSNKKWVNSDNNSSSLISECDNNYDGSSLISECDNNYDGYKDDNKNRYYEDNITEKVRVKNTIMLNY